MKCPTPLWTRLAICLVVGAIGGLAAGQQPTAPAAKDKDKTPAKAAPAAAKAAQPADAAPKSPYRRLAPGIIEPTDSQRHYDESFSRHSVVELLSINSNLSDFNFAKDVPFRHNVWALEFKFKPVRMIWVDVPQASGQMRRKLIWYMIYTVTNPGKSMHPVEEADGTFKVEYVDEPVRFIPVFLLETHTRMDDDAAAVTKVYVDHLIPVAMAPIREREDRNRTFYNTVEASAGKIAVGKTLWGIVTWEDVDPRTKWFSIYVEGLTNAYRWKDQPGEFTREDFGKEDTIGKGRRPARKILRLNFWRPSDEYFENEREIRYGVPGRVDYEWVYR